MTKTELYWLAGLLEGEGSFMAGPPSAPNLPMISMSSTDKDVVDRVAVMFGVAYMHNANRRPDVWKPSYAVRVRGKAAVDLMVKLQPLMGLRRQEQIRQALASYDPEKADPRRLTPRQVRSIRGLVSEGNLSKREIGRRFGITHASVTDIMSGRSYGSVE